MKSGHLGSCFRIALLCWACTWGVRADAARVLQIDVDHVIHPLTVEIITQGLAQAEERGDSAKAAEYYDKFVELWKDADEELQPVVEDVRQRIARLIGER